MIRSRPLTLRRWVVLVFGTVGLGLLPWTLWLSESLKPHHVTENWDLAWSGFDTALALAFVATAYAAWKRSPWVGSMAAMTGTLLIVDAWFDVVLESHADELRKSLVLALVVELPVAGLCFWIAYRTERFLAQIVEVAYGSGAASHRAAAGKGPAEGDLIGVLEVTADGEPAREPGDADTPA